MRDGWPPCSALARTRSAVATLSSTTTQNFALSLVARACARKIGMTNQNSSATIVVVDDDPHVRRMLERLFRLEGYEVLVAEDGRAALGVIEGLHRPVDLLVTDVRMPAMGGEELIATLSDRQVVRNVLFITGLGHLYEPTRKDIIVLEKPFPTAALLARARELLGPPGENDRQGLV